MNKRIRKKKGIYNNFKDSEWYDLDITIAKFVLPRLIKFKEKKRSVPCLLDDDGNIMDLNIADKLWDEYLNKMIWSFEQIINDSSPSVDWCKEYGKDLIAETQSWNDQVQEGLDLFARHFRNLWD